MLVSAINVIATLIAKGLPFSFMVDRTTGGKFIREGTHVFPAKHLCYNEVIKIPLLGMKSGLVDLWKCRVIQTL